MDVETEVTAVADVVVRRTRRLPSLSDGSLHLPAFTIATFCRLRLDKFRIQGNQGLACLKEGQCQLRHPTVKKAAVCQNSLRLCYSP